MNDKETENKEFAQKLDDNKLDAVAGGYTVGKEITDADELPIVEVECPRCKAKIIVPMIYKSVVLKCPYCGNQILVTKGFWGYKVEKDKQSSLY